MGYSKLEAAGKNKSVSEGIKNSLSFQSPYSLCCTVLGGHTILQQNTSQQSVSSYDSEAELTATFPVWFFFLSKNIDLLELQLFTGLHLFQETAVVTASHPTTPGQNVRDDVYNNSNMLSRPLAWATGRKKGSKLCSTAYFIHYFPNFRLQVPARPDS